MASTGQPAGGELGPAESADGVTKRVQEAEEAVRRCVDALEGLDDVPVSEHVARFDAVHEALTHALNQADELLSGSSGSGS
ncbi:MULTISPECIES: hypothetical protein [Actinopolyspora]|uniref:Uncharacterized protein n=1 Tax=Actinopolyspora saharensis TaxID=995062 RepID=A0A1H1A224_9ACTN|nr:MULTISPECIES: hypothetical protein [Actinopolyspora]NHD15456.1 hypothetical protein [Actinopolyspora sp. BKK2]NHE75330.1 hypothetical protein [Actinopolyspora sp. BKK1]SDQ33551.1 hypothetical protein SAMN04489718_1363 [Actinopolyspora saharensis]